MLTHKNLHFKITAMFLNRLTFFVIFYIFAEWEWVHKFNVGGGRTTLHFFFFFLTLFTKSPGLLGYRGWSSLRFYKDVHLRCFLGLLFYIDF